jgi:hypothetical protein
MFSMSPMAASIITIAFIALSPFHAKAAPKPEIEAHACPFECCKFGKWTSGSKKSIALYSAPGSKKKVGEVKPLAAVNALTGERHITPRRFMVTANEKWFKKGDEIYYTGQESECGMGYWHGRKGKEVEEKKCHPDIVECEGPPLCFNGNEPPMHELSKTTELEVWWVKIKTSSGVEGWTRETDKFSGKDSCG